MEGSNSLAFSVPEQLIQLSCCLVAEFKVLIDQSTSSGHEGASLALVSVSVPEWLIQLSFEVVWLLRSQFSYISPFQLRS